MQQESNNEAGSLDAASVEEKAAATESVQEPMVTSFKELDLHPQLSKAIKAMGFDAPTPIQAQTLPFTLKGADIIGQAQTGTGKTAAFLISAIQHMLTNTYEEERFNGEPRLLVLAPTRELVMQIAADAENLCKFTGFNILTLIGGVDYDKQRDVLHNELVDILVATPGRLIDFLRSRDVDLREVEVLVLDEADRMLEMGFADALDAIIGAAPRQRQTLLFSATFPNQISDMAASIMQNPVKVEVESTHETTTIEQVFYKVEGDDARMAAVELLLLKHAPESAVIFCSTKKYTQDLADYLYNLGFSAVALHGDLEQKDRDVTLVRFANKSAQVLVATDVAARGLDIESLDMVINFHLSRESDVHVHRIGRTGRAGAQGKAFSLYSAKEKYKLSEIEKQLGQELVFGDLPQEDEVMPHPLVPEMVTLQISGGKKQKVRFISKVGLIFKFILSEIISIYIFFSPFLRKGSFYL